MKLGIDVDGCLADFNSGFIDRIVKDTGRDLFPPRPFEIPTWAYPEQYGYTREELHFVWSGIKADSMFWQSLPEYDSTAEALRYFNGRRILGDDLYFITARPGVLAKQQTESWLKNRWPTPFMAPVTVLISSHKDLCAAALDLDVYVDDKIENVESVVTARNFDEKGRYLGERTRTFVYDQPWNRQMDDAHSGAKRIMTLVGMVELG